MTTVDISLDDFAAVCQTDETKLLIATIHYSLRDAAQIATHFTKEFVEETIIQPLKSTFGLVGSAKFTVKLLNFDKSSQTADIQLKAIQFPEFWAAVILSKSINQVMYKVRLQALKLVDSTDVASTK